MNICLYAFFPSSFEDLSVEHSISRLILIPNCYASYCVNIGFSTANEVAGLDRELTFYELFIY